jgi:hypothetical protein
MSRVRLNVRIDASRPDHHLWNNHGIWWCHYTLLRPDGRKRRVRVSLETRDAGEARSKRDELFRRLGAGGGDELAPPMLHAA